MSVMMAAMHNIGQCLVCSILFGYYVLTFYLPMLLFISLVTGSLTGIVIHRLLKIKFLIKDSSI